MFETRALRGNQPSWVTSQPGPAGKVREADRKILLRVWRLIVTARRLDGLEQRLKRQRRAFFHIGCAGHEIAQAAAAVLLRPGSDWFYPYYRDRVLALGLGVTPRDMLRQAMGKATDRSSGGREMPSHFGSDRIHIVNQSSPTGTQFLQAVGTAEAGALARALARGDRVAGLRDSDRAPRDGGAKRPSLPAHAEDEVVYVSGGEGSASEGEFYEAVCAALLKRLPVLFFIEDNEYAISVPAEAQTPGGNISALLRSFPGLYIEEVDGLDFTDSYEGLRRAIDSCRRGRGPALVHAHVVRLQPHSDSDNDVLYRPSAEKEADAARDPIPAFERFLTEEGFASVEELREIERSVDADLEAAVEEIVAEPDPDPAEVEAHLYAPQTIVVEPPRGEEGPPQTIVEAINRTLHAEMSADPRVVVFGEDVADVTRLEYIDRVKGKGGVFKVTHNLQRAFGNDRVFNTPITEAGIVGRALGMAVRGLRPVVEIQFFDYIWPAMHQIRNELSVMRWRSNGMFPCPVVIRVPIGGYLQGGALYHSQSGEAIFCHSPGIRVVMPSTAADAVGLLRASIRSGDPVLFLEHKHLYRQPYARRPYPGDDYVVPLGRARTARAGRDVTLVTYGALVEKSLRAAEELEGEGVDVEVIDLRSLQPYEWDAIRESVTRTGRLVVAYEENRSFGFGAEVAARAADELFDHLDAPVGRVASRDVPVAYSPVLEEVTLPQVEDIARLLRRTAEY